MLVPVHDFVGVVRRMRALLVGRFIVWVGVSSAMIAIGSRAVSSHLPRAEVLASLFGGVGGGLTLVVFMQLFGLIDRADEELRFRVDAGKFVGYGTALVFLARVLLAVLVAR